MKFRLVTLMLVAMALLATLVGCTALPRTNSRPDLRLVSGSENEPLEPLIDQFAKKHRYNIEITYLGSVDMMLGLESESFEYDAVWPAHSLWISLGDEQLRRVKHAQSIMRSPVVFGIRHSLAEQLGFVGHDVTVADLLAATEQGSLRFMMTNATQSNSGATAYFGFLYSFLGSPDVITHEDLQSKELKVKMSSLLSAVNRSSGSSGWLKELYLESEGRYDALVNYEAVIIELNQELVRRGDEPLYVVYPVDGQAIADSPLGYVDKGDKAKEEVFLELQAYLLSDEVQQELLDQGRRTGLVGLTVGKIDKRVFNPEWGIDTERVINQIRLPQPDVIREALDLYQVAFRKPSLTIFALDYSGSMAGSGERALEQAMAFLLDQENAKRWMIQTGPDDTIIVIPFDSTPRERWTVRGNAQADLNGLLGTITKSEPGGGTDIYLPVIEAYNLMQTQYGATLDAYQPSIILMTDGRSSSRNQRSLEKALAASPLDVPVFGILFGDADKDEVTTISELTRGRVFDGSADLVQAFRHAKGYN